MAELDPLSSLSLLLSPSSPGLVFLPPSLLCVEATLLCTMYSPSSLSFVGASFVRSFCSRFGVRSFVRRPKCRCWSSSSSSWSLSAPRSTADAATTTTGRPEIRTEKTRQGRMERERYSEKEDVEAMGYRHGKAKRRGKQGKGGRSLNTHCAHDDDDDEQTFRTGSELARSGAGGGKEGRWR